MRWLAVRLDALAGNTFPFANPNLLTNHLPIVTSIGFTAALVVALHGYVPAAFAGLALSFSGQLSGMLQYTVRVANETEAKFTSVQRMHTYMQVNT